MTGKRLLIIDDDRAMGDWIGAAAKSDGFETRVTSNPDAFKSDYLTFKPNVVVLDIIMPDVDGIELLNFLAQQKSAASIVLISGFDAEVLATAQRFGEALGLQIGGALRKPFHVDEMRNALAKGFPVRPV